MMLPIYSHDCMKCHFLGSIRDVDGDAIDLYFHPDDDPARRTVLARYGDEGCEYFSGLATATPDVQIALYVAARLAVSLGMLSEAERLAGLSKGIRAVNG